jgi:NAD(P) transhydrogenase
MLTHLDIEVSLVHGRERLLDFVDREIADAMTQAMRDNGVRLLLDETCQSVQVREDGLTIDLASNKQLRAEAMLFATGRQSNTDDLNLAAAGIEPGRRGLLEVNQDYQTSVPHIYAIGDVIGFPALAASSSHQGRAAAFHACRQLPMRYTEFMPYGIYGVPSISMIGRSEEELTAAGTGYEVGLARFRESARGQILGLENGLLKLLFARADRSLLGVHIIGEGATELVHIGQAVMALGGDLDYFLHTVFNYPTLSGTYKVAALDAYNKFEGNGSEQHPPVADA